jgi:hypothetical protein
VLVVVVVVVLVDDPLKPLLLKINRCYTTEEEGSGFPSVQIKLLAAG